MYVENHYVGDTEYVIRYKNGTHHVFKSDFEDYREVYTGHYDKCLEYCKEQEIAYQESLF